MPTPRASSARLQALQKQHESDPTMIGHFTTRTYHRHPDGKRVIERSPRANGRVYERVLEQLPHYAHRMNGGAPSE